MNRICFKDADFEVESTSGALFWRTYRDAKQLLAWWSNEHRLELRNAKLERDNKLAILEFPYPRQHLDIE